MSRQVADNGTRQPKLSPCRLSKAGVSCAEVMLTWKFWLRGRRNFPFSAAMPQQPSNPCCPLVAWKAQMNVPCSWTYQFSRSWMLLRGSPLRDPQHTYPSWNTWYTGDLMNLLSTCQPSDTHHICTTVCYTCSWYSDPSWVRFTCLCSVALKSLFLRDIFQEELWAPYS